MLCRTAVAVWLSEQHVVLMQGMFVVLGVILAAETLGTWACVLLSLLGCDLPHSPVAAATPHAVQ